MKIDVKMKHNITLLGIMTVAIVLFAVTARSERRVSVSSSSNAAVFVEAGSVVSQTWLSDVRNLNGVTMYYSPDDSRISDSTEVILSVIPNEAGACEVDASSVGQINEDGTVAFTFPKAAITIGKQYKFIYEVIGNEDAGISICVNTDYAGASIDEHDQSAAVKMDVVTTNMGKIAWLICVLLILLSVSLGYSCIFKKTVAETIGMSICSVGLLLYFFGMFNRLELGVWATLIVSCTIFGILLFEHFMGRIDLLEMLCTPGVVFYLMLVVILLIYNRSDISFRVEYDEFTLWGKSAKSMFYSDAMTMYPGTTLYRLRRYVPIMPVIQYFFMRLQGYFSEGILYWTYQIVSLSMLMSLFGAVRRENRAGRAVIGVLLVTIPLILCGSFYYSIYIDAFLGIIGAYTLLSYFIYRDEILTHRWFAWIRMALGACVMVLSKEMGCIIMVCIALVIVADIISRCIKNTTKKEMIELLGRLAGVCIISMVTFFSWEVYIRAHTAEVLEEQARYSYDYTVSDMHNEEPNTDLPIASYGQAETYPSFGFGQLLRNMVTGEAEYYQYESARGFIYLISSEGARPYGDFLLILIIASIIWHMLLGGSDSRLGMLMVSIGGFIYAAVLELMYLSVFSPYEAAHLSSSSRYLMSYMIVAEIFFGSKVIRDIFADKCRWNSRWMMAILLLVVLVLTPFEHYINKWCIVEDRLIRSNHDFYESTEAAVKTVAKSTDRIYYLNMDIEEEGKTDLVFMDAMLPLYSAHECGYAIKDRNHDTDALKAGYVTIEELNGVLNTRYDYVYLEDATKDFEDSYADLFEDKRVLDHTIYHIDHADSGEYIALKPVAYAIH